VIDEKHSIFDVMFLAEFPEKPLSQCGRSRRIQPHMQEFVRSRIDGSVQPELLAVDADHGLVNSDLIRTCIAGGL